MTLTIDLTPQAEVWLNTEAQQRAFPLNDFVRRVIEERMPAAAEPNAAPQLTEKNKAVIALMDEWLAKALPIPKRSVRRKTRLTGRFRNLTAVPKRNVTYAASNTCEKP